MKISIQLGTIQMVFTFDTDWILVGKILVVQNLCLCLLTKSLEEILLLADFFASVSWIPWVIRTFCKPCYRLLLSSQYFRFLKLLCLEFEFSFDAGYFRIAWFRWGRKSFLFLLWNFHIPLFCFFVWRFYGLILAISVSGLLIPVQNDHLKLQIGFCLFCFFQFILLGLGWGGWLAGRTHSFSFKFSWDKTSSWDSHPYHTWRWKDCHCISFSQEPVPDCLQLTSYLGGWFALDLCQRSFPLDRWPVIPVSCLCLRFPASPAWTLRLNHWTVPPGCISDKGLIPDFWIFWEKIYSRPPGVCPCPLSCLYYSIPFGECQ